jgi:hypothetical protein
MSDRPSARSPGAPVAASLSGNRLTPVAIQPADRTLIAMIHRIGTLSGLHSRATAWTASKPSVPAAAFVTARSGRTDESIGTTLGERRSSRIAGTPRATGNQQCRSVDRSGRAPGQSPDDHQQRARKDEQAGAAVAEGGEGHHSTRAAEERGANRDNGEQHDGERKNGVANVGRRPKRVRPSAIRSPVRFGGLPNDRASIRAAIWGRRALVTQRDILVANCVDCMSNGGVRQKAPSLVIPIIRATNRVLRTYISLPIFCSVSASESA